MTQRVLSINDIRAAADRLSGVAHRTPVLTSRTLDRMAGCQVLLKCENFQRVGAFKFRGAYNAIVQLPPDQLNRGVVAYSSGNHAQAVALAARTLGTSAVIVMPEDTPVAKREATAGYGAEVVTYDRYTEDREAIGKEIATQRGMALIPPYDHPQVMAGQGTAALELLEQVDQLDTLVVPVSGGGLLAGCSTVVAALSPTTRVIGVEPEAADDTRRSFAAGERVRIPTARTIADGLTAPVPGELTFAINREQVDEIVTVSDDEIRSAMRLAFERLKIVVEPSGAAGLAAVLTGRAGAGRTGVVISGGNVGLDQLAALCGN